MQEPRAKKMIFQPFYHRKVARGGSSRYMTMNKILPDDWVIVKVEVVGREENVRIIRITKLV